MSMYSDRTPSGGRLDELSVEECWELIATSPVGRLAWQGHDGLSVVPVNFVAHRPVIEIRTTPYSSIARECDDSAVAFQVDHVDPVARRGWSVLLRGRAALEFPGEHHAHTDAETPQPWVEGVRAQVVRITATEITGRRLNAG